MATDHLCNPPWAWWADSYFNKMINALNKYYWKHKKNPALIEISPAFGLKLQKELLSFGSRQASCEEFAGIPIRINLQLNPDKIKLV